MKSKLFVSLLFVLLQKRRKYVKTLQARNGCFVVKCHFRFNATTVSLQSSPHTRHSCMGLTSIILSENPKDKQLSYYCRQTVFGFFFPDISLLLSVLAPLGEIDGQSKSSPNGGITMFSNA
jgi:hypothetical protein